ncbi:MAG: histidine ammonia-lyase [Candidatus Riflebacteria bacterium]|nr:histidine ammonia-lyase [Candidatus Riflebacteria bacterium]
MIELNGSNLTIEKLRLISEGEKVSVSEEAMQKVADCRKIVEELVAEGRVVYGITTGFGHLCNTGIAAKDIERLQTNLIRSHATGVGEPYSKEIVRAVMAIRINSLLHGVSGVRPELIDALAELLNKDVTPWVPTQGSVGCSGDLAPLSHIMLVLMGEGDVLASDGRSRVDAAEALKKAGIKPINLKAKEGLALINGTAVMAAVVALGLGRALSLSKSADIVAAMTLEVSKASTKPFDPEFIALRPYSGMKQVAENVLNCVEDSEIRASHAGCKKVQDAYSLRCIPQVHGSTREYLNYLEEQITIELNAVTDNPIILSKDKIISGGHFHGQPLAYAGDILGIITSELANISERRIDRLLNPLINEMKPFLSIDPGVNSGLMIIQYTAAALVSENKVLAHPASVDSIPTSAYQEDHVSMGSIAARKALKILDNSVQVLAIEWLSACQAYEFLKPLKLGKGTSVAYECLREKVEPLLEDRILAPDLERAKDLLIKNVLTERVSKVVEIV